MALPRITYNGKTLNFTQDCQRLQRDPTRQASESRSAAGLAEVLNVRVDIFEAFSFQSFVNATAADATLKRNLQQWLLWAQAGLPWTFARDSSEMVLTTLTGAEAAGQTVIGLTSTTGIDVGGTYLIRSLVHAEPVKILTVDSAVQVTLVESLNHSYAAGMRFRSEQYWPARLLEGDRKNPIREMPPLWFDVELQFQEDVNLL